MDVPNTELRMQIGQPQAARRGRAKDGAPRRGGRPSQLRRERNWAHAVPTGGAPGMKRISATLRWTVTPAERARHGRSGIKVQWTFIPLSGFAREGEPRTCGRSGIAEPSKASPGLASAAERCTGTYECAVQGCTNAASAGCAGAAHGRHDSRDGGRLQGRRR